jgi:Saxitoxin biosynthesis operon protein SxtJ
MAGHETLRSHRKIKSGSDRNFGLVFAAVFALLGLWPAFRHAEPVRWWALGLGGVFLGLALFAAPLLAPLNRLWFRFGLLLHSVIAPLVMGLLFYGAVTPFALLLKFLGKDPLRLSRGDPESYWIERDPPGPAKNSMGQQF